MTHQPARHSVSERVVSERVVSERVVFERVALHTRLKPGKEAEYESVHAVIPPELDAALREAGVRTWRIWRNGLDLFHVVEVDDYAAMRAALRDHSANVPWQARMAGLLAVEDDYSGDGTGLGLV